MLSSNFLSYNVMHFICNSKHINNLPLDVLDLLSVKEDCSAVVPENDVCCRGAVLVAAVRGERSSR